MAVMKAHVPVNSIGRAAEINVILPDREPGRGFRTLYLLHGLHGNCDDWLNYSSVAAYVRDTDIAVVMPSGENSFYVDNPARGDYFGKYVGEEIVTMTRRMFRLSPKREDTWIGGLSMGGYGAVINGLKYSDTFGRIYAFSSAVHLCTLSGLGAAAERLENNRTYYESIFGDLTKAEGTEYDYKYLVNRLKAEGKAIPEIYMSCGTEDGLLDVNKVLDEFLTGAGVEHEFETWPGIHDWKFWDESIKKIIARVK